MTAARRPRISPASMGSIALQIGPAPLPEARSGCARTMNYLVAPMIGSPPKNSFVPGKLQCHQLSHLSRTRPVTWITHPGRP